MTLRDEAFIIIMIKNIFCFAETVFDQAFQVKDNSRKRGKY